MQSRVITPNTHKQKKHPLLSRLIKEIENDRTLSAKYDRTHNRHNRGQ